jgi:CDP-diacylglycerol pyrophosphatase
MVSGRPKVEVMLSEDEHIEFERLARERVNRDIAMRAKLILASAMVFSFDEKFQIQAFERARVILPMDPRNARTSDQTHNYISCSRLRVQRPRN